MSEKHPSRIDFERMRRRQKEIERKLDEYGNAIQSVIDLCSALNNVGRAIGAFTPPPLEGAVTADKLQVDDDEDADSIAQARFYNPKWRTYAGFRADMVAREKAYVDAQEKNGHKLEITK